MSTDMSPSHKPKSSVAGSLPPDYKRTSAKSNLRQAIWEAHQFMTFDEIDDFYDAVIYEIATDEP